MEIDAEHINNEERTSPQIIQHLYNDRVHTELDIESEDFEQEDDRDIITQVKMFQQFIISLVFVFIVLEIEILMHSSKEYALIPLITIEAKFLCDYLLHYVSMHMTEPINSKYEAIKHILNCIGNISSFIMIIVYNEVQTFFFFFASIPLMLPLIVSFCIKSATKYRFLKITNNVIYYLVIKAMEFDEIYYSSFHRNENR